MVGMLAVAAPVQARDKYQQQQNKLQELNARKIKEMKDLLSEKSCDKQANLVTPYFFEDTVIRVQNTISGSSIKDGKLAATSASIDEKSVTVNLGFALAPGFMNAQLNLMGRSEDGFLKIFEGGQYQKTIGIGGTVNIFTRSAKARFYCRNWYQLHNQLAAQNAKLPLTGDAATAAQKAYADKLTCFARAYAAQKQQQSRLVNPASQTAEDAEALAAYETLLKELAPILPDNFDQLTVAQADEVLKKLTAKDKMDKIARTLHETNWLQSMDAIQSQGRWNSFLLSWFTLKGAWEQQKYDYLNASFASGVDTYTDNYFTGSVSWNWLWSNKKRGFNLWVSPSVKIATNRDFSGNAMDLVKGQPFILNADTFTRITDNRRLYSAIPDGRTGFTLELPVSVYFPKAYCGLDVAMHVGLADSPDQLGGRIGVYVPVQVSEGNAVVIEPLIRFRNLNEGSNMAWKDKVLFGFNLSVTIPEFMKK